MVVLNELGFVTNDRIEGKANRLLYSYEGAFTKIQNPPIPIDRIVEQFLDLIYDWDDIPDEEDGRVLGCLIPKSKKILMNSRHLDYFASYGGTEAYTKAHEVGHWIMHVAKETDSYQPMLPGIKEGESYLCRDGKSNPREIQAEKFAAYLLMPRHLIMQEVNGHDLTKWPRLYALKDLFGVSITAMKHRLVEMGLIYVVDKNIFHSKEEAQGCIPLI